MSGEYIIQNIRKYCLELGISVSQLEKILHFSVGSISKWAISSPSIDKVRAVADYFHISVDELCGFQKLKSEDDFMIKLKKLTAEQEMIWLPCSVSEIMQLRISPVRFQADIQEIYCTKKDKGEIYMVYNDGEIELYITLDRNRYIRQSEVREQLQELWDLVKGQETEVQYRIEEYKDHLINL